jgi:hypothetical protein
MSKAKRIHPILIFTYLSIILLSSGCPGGGVNIVPPKFELETFSYDEVPLEIMSQVDGAGCVYTSQSSSDRILMINGVIKINGIYEILQSNNGTDFSKEKYENERWIIFTDVISNDSYTNESGTIKLRSKNVDGEFSVNILRSCGT